MTPALLKKVRDLVEAGATVIGPRPRKSPSLAGYPECDAEIERMAGELWGDCDGERVTEHAFGLGRVVWVRGRKGGAGLPPIERDLAGPSPALKDRPADPLDAGPETWSVGSPPLDEPAQYGDFAVVEAELAKMSVEPDFASDSPLRWTHRRDGPNDIYFVANPSSATVAATAVFRVNDKRPELWDPVTGTTRKLSAFAAKGERTSVPLRLEPFQSFFIVFREMGSSAVAGSSAPPGGDFPVPVDVATLAGPWEVSFDPTWGGPERVIFDGLADWSSRLEDGIRFYSGTAVYRKTFDLPPVATADGGRLWLDLGTVKNIASVRLNGRDLGVVWCDPWRVEITDAVKRKGNRLEIRVANLWPNRLIGDEREPPDAEYGRGGRLVRWPEWLLEGRPRPSAGRLTFSTWKHFAADSPLLPSGLLGPVRILDSKD
jgi:hypothetical protein